MDAATRAVLNEAETLLIEETSREALAALDEDAAIELETRIRRARGKYLSQYRRAASVRVAEHGGRGRARPENARAAQKAEAFERALSRVSRRVAVLAAQSAAALPGQRGPGSGAPTVPAGRTGDRAVRNPASERDRAGTLAAGARQQARRDSKRAGSR